MKMSFAPHSGLKRSLCVLALLPLFAVGCKDSTKDGSGTIKVGILHSQTGTMAISEKSLIDAEQLAIEEINAKGGLLKKKIEAVVVDPQSKFTDVFPEKAKQLLLKDKVVAVFGCWTSVSRQNVLPVFEENNGLLFYPVQYEGNECSKNVVYSGAAPNQQILPAVKWLVEKGYKKFYLLGSAYVFPRTANLIIVKYLKEKGLEPVAEQYTKLGHQDYANVVQDIIAKEPDVIFSTINGDSNTNFYKELAAQGIKAPADASKPSGNKKEVPVIAVSVGEDELRTLPPETVKGHLAAWNYFESIDTPKNKEFVTKFKKKYGADRVTDDPIAAAYAQVHIWALAVEKAKSTDVDKVREALRGGIEFDAPEGKIKLDPKTQHLYKYFRLGQILDNKQFKIIFETPEWIPPDPYPQVAFPGWSCDWTKGGITAGKAVQIGDGK
jgi:urea transport system substrate-binding protein